MVYSGFEIGIALPYPAVSIERDYGYVRHHPLAEAYIRRNPPPHNRPTWDLTSVLVRGPGRPRLFRHLAAGDCHGRGRRIHAVSADSPQGNHSYLVLRPEQKPRVLEALVQLSSQPPSRVDGGTRSIRGIR